jgi:hypothetical protein
MGLIRRRTDRVADDQDLGSAEETVAHDGGRARRSQNSRAGAITIRQDAKIALDSLLSLTRNWRTSEASFTFDHIALCSDRYILTVDQGEADSLKHCLSFAPTDGLTDEEFSVRIGSTPAPEGGDPPQDS